MQKENRCATAQYKCTVPIVQRKTEAACRGWRRRCGGGVMLQYTLKMAAYSQNEYSRTQNNKSRVILLLYRIQFHLLILNVRH